MQKQQDGCVKMAVYVSNAHNTVFGSKRSRLLVAHRGHLKLEIQTAFWHKNGFLKQRRYFVEPDRKFLEINGVQVRITKIVNFKRHSEIETENLFALGFRNFQLAALYHAPNRRHVQFTDPISRYVTEWPMSVAWWRH